MRVDGPGFHLLLFSLLFGAICVEATGDVASYRRSAALYADKERVTLSNAFVSVDVSLKFPAIISLKGCLAGNASFSKNVLSDPITLEREDVDGSVCTDSAPTRWAVIENTSSTVEIKVDLLDCEDTAVVAETWSLRLDKDDRALAFEVNTSFVGVDVSDSTPIRAVRRTVPVDAPSIYALFDRGVVQMMRAANASATFQGTDALTRVYALGSGHSLDVQVVSSDSTKSTTVLLSRGEQVAYQQVLVGALPKQDRWSSGWETANAAPSWSTGTTFETSYRLTPNDWNFPAGGLSTGPNLPHTDLVSLLTGLYASAPGNLCTYDNEVVDGNRVAQIATTIASPGRGYAGTYNYFDPDNFIALSAILYSGDAYLQKQARDVIMRSGDFLNRTTGQLPHHFQGDTPTYLALSGATQTGPNIFWVKTALRYALVAGDMAWLRAYLPTLRLASDFCFDLIDPEVHMIDAPGSLMIDVFIREHYTSDSNAMMVGFLRDFAAAERAVGSADKAAALEAKAENMTRAMNAYLWDGVDHYVTQINTDLKTKRDFVDYDSNLIAVAHDVVPTAEEREAILKRVDSGSCSSAQGGGAQWVSEVYYGPDDTTNGNIGDSRCSMGRIAWFDAHARKLHGTREALETFDDALATLQADLIRDTWMHERYGCDGKQQENRTEYYFEYPSTVVMLLREVRYGIDVQFDAVTLSPFGPSNFTYDIGDVFVQYQAEQGAILRLPGNRTATYAIHGMTPGGSYRWGSRSSTLVVEGTGSSDGGTVIADKSGVVVFRGLVGAEITVEKE